MMAGYLLARAGVRVVVLEKHADFLRDFRGDTVHPSTLQAMHDLGLLERFLKRPHTEITQVEGKVGDETIHLADLRHLPTAAKFVALMPQWDFLDFVAEEGRRFPEFEVRMSTEAVDFTRADGTVTGVVARSDAGRLEIAADLVIAADGRDSKLRDRAGLAVKDIAAPIDVLWMRLPRHSDDKNAVLGRIGPGYVLVLIDRGDYYQAAFVLRKGGFETIRAGGLDAFKARLVRADPELVDRVEAIASWDDVKLLTVTVDRLERWSRPGLILIGDAAHAMSPVGGVGINVAIQDAICAANILAAPLSKGGPAARGDAGARATAAPRPRAGDPGPAGLHPPLRADERVEQHQALPSALAGEALQHLPGPTAHPGARDRVGLPHGARAHPRRARRLRPSRGRVGRC